VKDFKAIRRSEVYQGDGTLPDVADRAFAAGYRYFTLMGKVFELEAGRIKGSSLGLHSIKAVEIAE